MRAVQPQVPGFDEHILARDQTEYVQLPAVFTEIENVPCVVRREPASPTTRPRRLLLAPAGTQRSTEQALLGEPS